MVPVDWVDRTDQDSQPEQIDASAVTYVVDPTTEYTSAALSHYAYSSSIQLEAFPTSYTDKADEYLYNYRGDTENYSDVTIEKDKFSGHDASVVSCKSIDGVTVTHIVFDKNDPVAKGTTKPYTYVYGTQEALLPASGFTRRNARFLGWSFSKDATKPDFTDAQVMEALTEAKRKGLVVADATIDDPATAMFLLAAMAGKKTDLTLYAVWDVERHTATLTGGTRQTDPWGHTTSEGTWTGGRVRIDADAIEPGFTLPREAVTVEAIPGWYLKGWRITRDGVTYEVMDPEAIYSLTMDADTSFEPIWGNRAQEEAERRHRLGLDRTYGADQAADRIPQTADYLMDLGALSLSLAGLGVLVLLLALLVFSTQCDRLAPPASPGLPPNSSR